MLKLLFSLLGAVVLKIFIVTGFLNLLRPVEDICDVEFVGDLAGTLLST